MRYKDALFRIVSAIDEKEKNAKFEKLNYKKTRMISDVEPTISTVKAC